MKRSPSTFDGAAGVAVGEFVGGLVRLGVEIVAATGDACVWDDTVCGTSWGEELVVWDGVGRGGVTLLDGLLTCWIRKSAVRTVNICS